jgi:hypothetical protein
MFSKSQPFGPTASHQNYRQNLRRKNTSTVFHWIQDALPLQLRNASKLVTAQTAKPGNSKLGRLSSVIEQKWIDALVDFEITDTVVR